MGFFSPSKWEFKASVAVSQKTQLRVKAPPASVFAPGAIKREIQEFVPFFDNKRPICRLCSLFLGNSSICFIQKWDNFVCHVRPKTQKKRAVPPLLENFCTSDGNFFEWRGVLPHLRLGRGEGWLQTTFYYPKYSRGVNYSFRWVSFATHSFFLSYFFGRCKKNHFNYPSVNRGELRLNLGWMGIIAASRKIPAEEIVIILTLKGGEREKLL